MLWQVGRFVRGMIDEDVPGAGVDTDAVFAPERIAEALAAVAAGEPLACGRPECRPYTAGGPTPPCGRKECQP